MRLDVQKTIKNLDGEEIKQDGKAYTVKKAVTDALLAPLDKDRDLMGSKKAELYALAVRIHNATDHVEITVEEASTIKERVASAFAALIVGQVYEIIEGGRSDAQSS